MRIIHVITRMILGGAQENTLLTMIGQKERGHDVTLVTGPTTGPEGTLLPLVYKHGIRVVEHPHLIRAIWPLADWRAYGALRQCFRDEKPDVVHTHSSKAGILGRMAAWKERVPRVLHTIHGLPFHPFQSKLKNTLYIAAERFAAKRCHRILSVCDAMTDEALAAGVGKREQYTTVYSGMEIEPFLRRDYDVTALRGRYGFSPDDVVIGKVARLFELKGHEILLDAFITMAHDFPRAKLFFVGDGILQDTLKAKARACGLSERVVFAGLVPRENVAEHVAIMDVVAHCSLREGLARVLPQALLSEKAVISFDVNGAREVVIPGVTGLLVPPQNQEELVRALRMAMMHPEQMKALAAQGCHLCRERFDWHTMVEAILQAYA